MAGNHRDPHISIDDLSAYLDGQIDDADARSRIEGHLTSCARCRDELSQLRAVSALLADLPEPELPRSFRLRPEDVARPGAANPASIDPWIIRYQSTLRAAAMAAVLLLAVVLTIDLLPGRDGADDMVTMADQPAVDIAPDADEAAEPEADRDEADAMDAMDAAEAPDEDAAVEPDDAPTADGEPPLAMDAPQEDEATDEETEAAVEEIDDAAISPPDDPASGERDAELTALAAEDDGLSTLRLLSIGLGIVAVGLLFAGFVVPRWWSASARQD